jgi:hypothetical protein
MHSALRAQYLQRLGVIAYVPRGITSESTAPVVHWEGPEHASLVFLFESPDSSIDWALPIYQLLKKIMDAVTCPEVSMALCWSPAASTSLPALPKNTTVVSFGRGLTQSRSVRIINTLPLATLQQSDAAKRTLWQELKAMKAVYGR